MPRSDISRCLACVFLVFATFEISVCLAGVTEFLASSDRARHFPQNSQNEAAVAANPLNPLNFVAGGNDAFTFPDCPSSANGTVCLYYNRVQGYPNASLQGVYVTVDGGKTWKSRYFKWLGKIKRSADSDPQLAYGPRPDKSGRFSWKNGARLYFTALATVPKTSQEAVDNAMESQLALVFSDTGGLNFSDPSLYGYMGLGVNDYEKMWVDSFETSPYFGSVYVAWNYFPGSDEDEKERRRQLQQSAGTVAMTIAVSRDGGNTFLKPIPVSSTFLNLALALVRTDSRGGLYVLASGQDPDSFENVLVIVKSTNGGKSFSSTIHVTRLGAEVQPELPGTNFRSVQAFNFAVAPLKNNRSAIFVTWTEYAFVTRGSANFLTSTLRLARSTDGGATWRRTTVATGVPGKSRTIFGPAIAVSSKVVSKPEDVAVVIGFQAADSVSDITAAGPGVVLYDAYYVASSNGGVNVTKPARISRKSSDPAASLRLRGLLPDDLKTSQTQFIGDYTTASAGPAGALFTWTDTRNGKTCAAFERWLSRQGPRPNIYTQCDPAFGNSDIYVALIPWPRS